MNSMTGFGEAEEKTSIGVVRAEVKTLNHKFKDLVLNLPTGFSSLEEPLRKRLSRIKRGRVNFFLQIFPGIKKQVLVDKGLLKEYAEKIREIQKGLDLEKGLSVDTLLNIHGLFCIVEDEKEKKKVSKTINIVTKKAIENLIFSRRREGELILKDLKKRIKTIKSIFMFIKKRQEQFLKGKKISIVQSADWETFLKTTDITEEMVRIGFHLKNFERIVEVKSKCIGKELDFISQEMMREANTMTAKSQDKEVIFNLIQMKAEIEKIREQLQNVE